MQAHIQGLVVSGMLVLVVVAVIFAIAAFRPPPGGDR